MISKSQAETEVSFHLEETTLEARIQRLSSTTAGDRSARPRRQAGGLAYAPFGEEYTVAGKPWIQFTGVSDSFTIEENQNETGTLDDFTFRRYSPTQGRWISPDPAGLAAVDPTNPQTWNRYAYVMNQPLRFTDPLGLFGYCPPVDGPYIPGGVNADGTTNCDTPVCPGFGYSIIDGYFVCGSPTQIAAAEQGCASGNNGNCPSGGQTGGGGGPAGPPTPLTPQQIKELQKQKICGTAAKVTKAASGVRTAGTIVAAAGGLCIALTSGGCAPAGGIMAVGGSATAIGNRAW